MKIEAIHCPACFAAATILPGADRMTCEYCGTTSFVEQSQGQVTQNALAALDPVAFDAPSRSVAAASPGRNQSIRGLGCLGWGLLWMTLFLLFGTLLTQVAGEAGPLLSLVLSIAVVVYLQRRRKRKALAA